MDLSWKTKSERDKRVKVKKERNKCNFSLVPRDRQAGQGQERKNEMQFFFKVPKERDNRVKAKTDSLNHLLSRIYFKNYCYRRKLKCNLFEELVQSKEKKENKKSEFM